MKGTNEIHLCKATMIEALQLWAANTFKEGSVPTVKSVEAAQSGRYESRDFVVTVEGPAEEPSS